MYARRSRLGLGLQFVAILCSLILLTGDLQAQTGRPDDRGSTTGSTKGGSKAGSKVGSKSPKGGSGGSKVAPVSKVKSPVLTITVTPLDSTVLVDNGKLYRADPGTGTLRLSDLAPGVHSLIARRDGYRDETSEVTLKAGDDQPITMTLELLKGTLNVKPSIDGAEISLRSLDRNQSVASYTGAIQNVDFPPGDYEISVSKAGYQTATRTVTIKAGAIIEIEPRLDPLPPPRPTIKRQPRPMSAQVEVEGKYLIVRLSGTSDDDSTALGSINVSVSKAAPGSGEVSGTLNGSPCRVDFFKMENVDEWSMIETPGPSNQYSRIVVRVRPKDSKRPVRFAINWRSVGGSSEPKPSGSSEATFAEAVPTHKALPTIPSLARSSQTRGVVNVSVVIDESGNVISAKAIDGPMALRQAAENAARQWKFRPATRNGLPTQSTQTIRFNFEK